MSYRRASGSTVQRPAVSSVVPACSARGMGRSHLEHARACEHLLGGDADGRQPALAVCWHRQTDVPARLSLRTRRTRTWQIYVPHHAVQRRRRRTTRIISAHTRRLNDSWTFRTITYSYNPSRVLLRSLAAARSSLDMEISWASLINVTTQCSVYYGTDFFHRTGRGLFFS